MLIKKIPLLLLSLGLSMEATIHRTPVGLFTCKEENADPAQLLKTQLITGYLCGQGASSAMSKKLIGLIASYLQVRVLNHKAFLKACKNAFLIRCKIKNHDTIIHLYLPRSSTFGDMMHLLFNACYPLKDPKNRIILSPILLVYWHPNSAYKNNPPFKKEVSKYFEQGYTRALTPEQNVFGSHASKGNLRSADDLYKRYLGQVFNDARVTICNQSHFDTSDERNHEIGLWHFLHCKRLIEDQLKLKGDSPKGPREDSNYKESVKQDNQSVAEALIETLQENHKVQRIVKSETLNMFAFCVIVSCKGLLRD